MLLLLFFAKTSKETGYHHFGEIRPRQRDCTEQENDDSPTGPRRIAQGYPDKPAINRCLEKHPERMGNFTLPPEI